MTRHSGRYIRELVPQAIINSSVLLNAFNIRFFFTYSGSQLSVIMVSATTDLLESASGNNSVDG